MKKIPSRAVGEAVDRGRRRALALASGVALLAPMASAWAAFPEKPINLIVPFPPGGRTDLVARVVAHFLQLELNQPVVVINKPGAGGVLGAKEVARADPDGYTVGFFSTGFLTTQYTVPTPTSLAEYELVSLINYDPAAISVSSERGWNTIADVVAAGRAKPMSLRVGINPGSSAHIFAAAFMTEAGIQATYVPFRGGSERAAAIGGGHIDVDFDIVAAMKPMQDSGKIKILGIAADQRDPLYPELPTMKEGGVNLTISSWHGLFVPKGASPAIRDALDQAVAKLSAKPEFLEQMKSQSLGVKYLNQKDFKEFMASQDEQFKSTIDRLGLNKVAKSQ